MLPWMKPKQMASVIMQTRKKDGNADSMALPENEMHPQLMKHAEDLISAMHGKDATKVANLLQDIHEHFEAKEPESPVEGE